MKKIMFICTGNICRSAMAEGYLKKLKDDENLDIEVCSSGLYAEDGAGATYLAKEAMADYGVNLDMHMATNTSNSKIREMDIILCATSSHKQILLQLYPDLGGKIFTIKEYAYGLNTKDKDISDPWGYDITVYRHCALELVNSINIIAKTLDKKENNI